MDDRTRATHTEPENQANNRPEGTGWSTPQQGTSQAAGTLWSQSGDDTGAIPRPHDTRQIPTGGSEDAAQQPQTGTASSESAQAQAPYGGVPPYDSTAPAGAAAGPPPKRRRGTALVAAVALGAALVGGAAGAGIVYALDEDDTTAPASSLDNQATDAADMPEATGVENVAQEVTPSVVSIGIQSPRGTGSGSGVIISADGQIMTNAHVAAAAGDGTLTVTFHDGTTAEAEVVGMDERMDVAVLQAQDVSDLQPVELGNSDDLSVGSQVIAFGSPLGLEGTVTQGIVSALHRPVQAGDPAQQDEPTVFEAIQTDAPINPGNSGGPLVNAGGQVVGINTAIATSPGSQGSIGLGFAIPINTASYIAEQIVDGEEVEFARIGIEVSNGEGPDPAATVAGVQDGTAADEAGLEEGDVITHIDGRFMSDATALVAAARSFQPGDEVTLTYVRDGEENTVEITLGSSADDEQTNDE